MKYKYEMELVKEIVEKLLSSAEEYRNDDDMLISKIKTINPNIKSDSIIRARRIIQNKQLKFLPTSPEVLVQRRFRVKEVKAYFGSKSAIFDFFMDLYYNKNGVSK